MFARALALLSVAMTVLGVAAAATVVDASEPAQVTPDTALAPAFFVRDEVQEQVVPTARPEMSSDARAAKAARAARLRAARQPYLWPIAGRITSGFGLRRSPVTDEREFHGAVDIACNTGEQIRAARDGVVLLGGRIKVLGRAIVIQHADGWSTAYGHMDTLYVYGGLSVRRGQVIGTCGHSGRATGPHLHFEIRRPGAVAIDPLELLPEQRHAHD